MVMRGFIFHPVFCSVLVSGSYLVCFCLRACSGNLSWQYANSMNCTVWLGDGTMGVGVWLGAPNINKMFGLSFGRQWHGGFAHVHMSNHSGIVKPGGLLLRFPYGQCEASGKFVRLY